MGVATPLNFKKKSGPSVSVMIDVVVASYISTRLPIGRSLLALHRFKVSKVSRMCGQERTGVMLKLVHFRGAMQLDASHVKCELVEE